MLIPQTDDQTDGLKGGEILSWRRVEGGGKSQKADKKNTKGMLLF